MNPQVLSFATEMAQAKIEGRRLVGYASVFNYPIESGTPHHPQKTFVRDGFFTRTLQKNRDTITVMVNHGMDPAVGMLPIGRPEVMEQDKTGLWTETLLADTRFNREELIPLLETQSLRSMSIQFVTEQESHNEDRSERYLEQGRLYEFGPVTIPANEAATAQLQSLEMFAHLAADLETLWDGAAAMRTCSSASEFRRIAFERSNDSDPDTAAHWALPHHPRPGAAADPQGVASALAALNGARGGAPNLRNAAAARSHLEAHRGESSSEGDTSSEAARLQLLAARTQQHADHEKGLEDRWHRLVN
jgi:HK97 family phage prohead protease